MSDVSRETEQLEHYAALVRKWSGTINLVAPSTLKDLEFRHIQDSKHLVHLSSNSDGNWADLGSGGGLPAIVVAILRPGTPVTLVESDQRKCSFLRTVVRELSLRNVTVLNHRIEKTLPLNSQNLSARALAPLPLLMSYVARHLAPSGRAWLMKGRNWQSEVDEARKTWKFDLLSHSSITDPDAAILEITGICHA